LQGLPVAQVVAEAGEAPRPGTGSPCPPAPGEETPRFWVERQTHRWRRLLEIERRQGRAYADTDPIKLHYAFGLAMLGARPRAAFDEEYEATREAMDAERLGFADHVVLLAVSAEVLAARKVADATRSRRNFSLHARLGPSLDAYYAALEHLRPGMVRRVEVEGRAQPEDVRAVLQGLDTRLHGRYDVGLLHQFKHALDHALERG